MTAICARASGIAGRDSEIAVRALEAYYEAFLVEKTSLYMRVCLSVGPLDRPSAGPSVRSPVGNQLYFQPIGSDVCRVHGLVRCGPRRGAGGLGRGHGGLGSDALGCLEREGLEPWGEWTFAHPDIRTDGLERVHGGLGSEALG